MKKGKLKKRLTICAIILDIFMCLSLFVLYGPWPYFRTFWITTAMTTMNHQYLAHWFYSDDMIAKVLAENTIDEVDEDTDTSLIDKNKNKNDKYEDEILTKDKGNNLYKVINISGTGYKGFLIAIYDPSKVKLAMTRYVGTRGDTLDVIAKNNKAVVAVNASGFPDSEGKGKGVAPTGSVVKGGKIVYTSANPGMSGGVIGFDKYNRLILTKDTMKTALTKYNLRDAVEFGPFLIVNGKSSSIKGNGGWGIAPRTVIGQRRDGIVLFLIIDGRQPGYSIGADMNEVTKIMENYNAINAANLDGGASTGLIVNNKITNRPCGIGGNGLRYLPDAWIVTK